jgi:hypothetical protein
VPPEGLVRLGLRLCPIDTYVAQQAFVEGRECTPLAVALTHDFDPTP